MKKKILIVLGHPNKDSFCGGLAESYKNGAVAAGAEVMEILVSDLDFDPVLHAGYKQVQELEPDLIRSQELIKWAEHIVFVYPTWWGTYPALFKGFLDRIFLPGFAFKYRKNSLLWDKYLTGKSAHLIVTMDAPGWYYRLFYGSAGNKAMKKATLEFSGIKPVRTTAIGSVKMLTPDKRKNWLHSIEKYGIAGR
jgi:NAD(P)H dehydrogenase (quinone)